MGGFVSNIGHHLVSTPVLYMISALATDGADLDLAIF